MSDSAPVSPSAQRHLDLIRHREETLARYQHHPGVAEWLSQFSGNQGERFLARYAEERASALVDGATYWQLNQDEKAALVQEATERLWEIQQRKLFELQCRWRAGEVALPTDQVELTDDFELLAADIERCRLVPAIAAAEVEDYVAFLLSDDCTDAGGSLFRPHDWQNYPRYRRYLLLQAQGQDPAQVRREASRQPAPGLRGLMAMLDDFFLDYPDWYAHCDALAGPPNLVLYLPDHRGEREAYYDYIGRTGQLPDPYASEEEDDEEEADDAPPTSRPPAASEPVPAPLPALPFQQFAALTDTLMRQFETPELLRFHEALVQEPDSTPVRPSGWTDEDDEENDEEDDDEGDDGLTELGRKAGRRLREIPERLPIAAHPDWRVALHYTWLNWRKQRLAAALRAAYAAYAAREQAGAPHPAVYDPRKADMQQILRDNRQRLAERIRKGRGLAGEPQDLDF